MPERAATTAPFGIRPSTQLSRKGLPLIASFACPWAKLGGNAAPKTLWKLPTNLNGLGSTVPAKFSVKAWSGGGGGGGKRSIAFWIL